MHRISSPALRAIATTEPQPQKRQGANARGKGRIIPSAASVRGGWGLPTVHGRENRTGDQQRLR